MDFFQVGPLPKGVITGSYYNLSLVALSYCIAVLASFVALDMAGRLRSASNRLVKSAWLVGGAFAMGAGIWSMHFIGMLAFVMPMPMEYDFFWTALSLIVAILVSGFALFILRDNNRLSYLILSGIFIGIGIASMHYVGMHGMEGQVKILYKPGLFFLSIFIAIAAAEAALWLALRSNQGLFRQQVVIKIISALVMGAAICGMHYTGMAAAVFIHTDATTPLMGATIPPYGLAFYIAAITIVILGLALLASIHKQILDSATQNEKNFLDAILYNLEDGIIACDARGKIIVFNNALEKMTKWTASKTANLQYWIESCNFYKPNSNNLIPSEERPLYLALKGAQIHSQELILTNKYGDHYEVRVDGQPILNKEERIIGAVIAIHDITDQKKMEKQLITQATHDMLTGLPNRMLLIDRINQAINISKRSQAKLALLFIDVDRFKNINDQFGHASGDELLLIVAKRLVRCLREGDTVARLGGDEFVVLLTSLENEEHAITVTHKILKLLSNPLELGHQKTKITVSIGVSIYPKNGEDADTLLKNADAAMYKVKAENRNNFKFYSDDMNIRTVKRMELEKYLFSALENREFLVYYQPIIDMNSGYIIACEALLRWNHPIKGLLLPGDFIPLAEETGEIVKIGEWVLNEACMQNKKWQDMGLQPIRISVNVSSLQFNESEFLTIITNALNSSGLDPKYLDLELTESIILQNPEEALRILRKLKDLGINISLDDFGIGYSSLGYLSRLPVNKLKIDRSFVHNINQHTENSAIVLAIINMASSMKLKVTAEGMETENELAFLRFNRCDEVQGYYFSVPLPVEEITNLLINNPKFEIFHSS